MSAAMHEIAPGTAPVTSPFGRRLAVAAAAFALLAAPAPWAAAAEGGKPIVHDAEAAAELEAAYAKLQALPAYRQTMQDLEPVPGPPQTIDHLGGGRMRMTQEDTVGTWKGTTETVIRPGRAAFRFVSPELDADLAKMKARQRAATLVSVGMQVREILQSAAMGPLGILSAVESGLSLLGGGGGALSMIEDADAYGKWHCSDLPALPIPGAGAAGAAAALPPEEKPRVERLPPTTIDGEPARGYRSEQLSGGANLSYRTWVLESTGLPRRSEMSIDMPGFQSKSVMEFSPATGDAGETPPCLGE